MGQAKRRGTFEERKAKAIEEKEKEKMLDELIARQGLEPKTPRQKKALQALMLSALLSAQNNTSN